MISYRSDRELRSGAAVVRVSMHGAPGADIARVPGGRPPGTTLSRRRVIDFCRVAAAL